MMAIKSVQEKSLRSKECLGMGSSYRGSIESLSESLGLSWRNGDLIAWIMEGISHSPTSHRDDDVIQRAMSLLEGSFPDDVLKEERNKELLALRLSLFMSYFASVKHNWQPLKSALLGLKLKDQRSIEKMFSLILEEKWSDPLFEEDKCSEEPLDVMEVSRPLPCPTTPINRFKKMKSRSSPSSFHFSPNSSSSCPLKDFFTSPVTAQISKYQKIAEEKTKLLRATRLELDYEKVETFNLAREREELIKERRNLRKSLEYVRSSFYSSQVSEEEEDPDANSSYEHLQKRLAEQRDNENYVLKLEEQLRDDFDERNELISKVESQTSRLEETSLLNTKLESRLIELQASFCSEKELSKDLMARCEEYELQIMELREIINSRRSDKPSNVFGNNNFENWSVFPSASIGDISIDDPLVSMGSSTCPFPQGENMAETLVIPQLEEKLSLVNEQLNDYMAKTSRLENDLEISKRESAHFKDLLAEAECLRPNDVQLISLGTQTQATISTIKHHTEDATTTGKNELANEEGRLRKWNEFKCQIRFIMETVRSLVTLLKKEEINNDFQSEKVERKTSSFEINSLIKKIEEVESKLIDSECELMCEDILNDHRSHGNYEALELKWENLRRKIGEDSKVSKARILELEVEKSQIKRRLELVSLENMDFRSKLSSKTSEVDTLTNTMRDYVTELCAHQFEIKSMQEALSNLKDVEDPSKSYEKKLNSLCHQLKEMSRFLQESENGCQIEISKTKDIFEKLKAREEEYGRLKREHESLVKTSAKREEEHQDQLKKTAEERKSVTEEAAKYESNLTTMRSEYEGQLEIVQNKHSVELSKVKSEAEACISDLHRQVNDLVQCKEDLQRKNDVCENNYVTNLESLNLLRNSMNDLENLYSQCRETIGEVEARNGELKKMTSAMVEGFSSKEYELTKQTKELKSTVASLEEDKKFLGSQLEGAQRKLEASGKELEDLRMDLSAKSEKWTSLKSDFQTKLENKENEITEVASQLKSTMAEMEELKSNLNREVADNRSLKKSFLKSEECDRLETQTKELKVHIERLREEKEGDEKRFSHEIEELKSKFELESESLHSRVYESNQRLKMKTEELCELKKKLSSLLEAKFSIAFENQKSSEPSCSRAAPPEMSRVLNALETEKLSLKEELNCMKTEKVKGPSCFKEEQTLGEIFGNEITKMRQEMELKTQGLLADQKARYQSRMSVIANDITKQYQEKFEQLIKVKDAEIEETRQRGSSSSNDTLKKLNSAKGQIGELSKKLDEKSLEFLSIMKKYNATKNVILKLKEEKEFLQKKLETLPPPSDSFNQSVEIEQLKLQLRKIKTENRQLSVQFSAAETKIRQMQKKSLEPSTEVKDSPFKVPSYKNTPGRTKAGRTRSEIHIRRPPCGSGALFNIDDEDGEFFSHSYLASSAAETPSSDGGGGDRLSELMRRNVLQPAHLKSSYPVETQFYGTESFKESELLEGRKAEEEGLLSHTLGPPHKPSTLNRSLRPHSIIGIYSENLSSPRGRKRGSFAIRSNSIREDDCDAAPPPKDIRMGEKSDDSSISEEATTHCHPSISDEKSPPMMKSPIYNHHKATIKSFISHTPFKLKNMVKTALGTKKSYNVKLQRGDGGEDSSASLKKKSLSKKQLGKKKLFKT